MQREPVRQPLFAGRQPVRALWFDVSLLGEDEARRRVLAHWESGARLFLAEQGYLLEWTRARWHRVEDLDGLALCDVAHLLSSAPLTPVELAQQGAGAVWLVRGAAAHAASPQARIDPSVWLDLRAIALREPLRPPVGSVAHASDLAAPTKPLRDILGAGMPTSSPRRDAFMRAARRPAMPRGAGALIAAAAMVATVSAGGMGGLGMLLARLLQRRTQGKTTGEAQRPDNGQPWTNPLARLAARVAMFTRISRLLGWRQANYLRSMLAMFEKGDLEQALRHAIALGGDKSTDPRPALGTPSARSALDITGARAGTPTIGLGTDLEQHLRATYRRTFEQLDRAGRIDEAVFVLAELLQCGAEAVTYLETKGRMQQAAQLADTLDLAPDLRVRLWLLAGNPDRAIGLARLYNNFSAAVRQLEKTHSMHAAPLRCEWAHYLAARGDLAEAVDAIWPLPEQRAQARTWLAEAQRAGGTLGMRALARSLALLPDALAGHQPAIVHLLTAPGSDGVQLRARMVSELLALAAHSPATRRLSGLLARHVIAERRQGWNQLEQKSLDKLVDISGATLLRADLPSLKMPPPSKVTTLSNAVETLALTLIERGLLPIHDAVRLPDGDYLLALGEGGIVRVNARGRQLAHFPVPAFHLVLAEGGQRALGLAQRDATYRVSRIDLIAGKVIDWLSLPLQFWSERYDGVTWNVVFDGRLVAVDTSAPHLAITWQVRDLPGKIVAYNDAGNFQVILLALPDGRFEHWSYAQPGRQLRQREEWACDTDDEAWSQLIPDPVTGAPWRIDINRGEMATSVLLRRIDKSSELDIALDAHSEVNVQLRQWWWLVVASGASQTTCMAMLASGKIKASVSLVHPDHARMRLQDDHFLVVDRAGRLVDIDSTNGAVTTLLL